MLWFSRLFVAVAFLQLVLESNLKQVVAEQRDPMTSPFAQWDVTAIQLKDSGAASVSRSSWPRERFLSSDNLEPVFDACVLAKLMCYCPHRFGVLDIMAVASPIAEDFSVRTECDECIFGRHEDYAVELWDSTSLLSLLELASCLPNLRTVTVYTKRSDEVFVKALHKVNATREVRLRDPKERLKKSGWLRGTVVDSEGEPVKGATVMIYSRDGELVMGSGTNGDGIFCESEIREVPYRVQAFAPQAWFRRAKSHVSSSKPVDFDSGDTDVCLVIDPARKMPQPPDFFVTQDDDGKRVGLLEQEAAAR